MLKKDDVKTLIASSLYGFYNEILKDKFTTKKYVDDAIANITGGTTIGNIEYDKENNMLIIEQLSTGGVTYDEENNMLIFPE